MTAGVQLPLFPEVKMLIPRSNREMMESLTHHFCPGLIPNEFIDAHSQIFYITHRFPRVDSALDDVPYKFAKKTLFVF